MGIGKLAKTLGDIPFEEARTVRDEYDEKVPFIRALASAVMDAAGRRSEVRTLLGRKCRFPMRELKVYSKEYKTPIHADKLEERWADVLNTPVELRDKNWASMNPEQVAEIKGLMENCAPGLTIPSRVDVGLGENWGSAK